MHFKAAGQVCCPWSNPCAANSVNDFSDLVPPSMSLPWPAVPLVLSQTCPHGTYSPPLPQRSLGIGRHPASYGASRGAGATVLLMDPCSTQWPTQASAVGPKKHQLTVAGGPAVVGASEQA